MDLEEGQGLDLKTVSEPCTNALALGCMLNAFEIAFGRLARGRNFRTKTGFIRVPNFFSFFQFQGFPSFPIPPG